MVTIDWRIRRLGQAAFTVWAVITLSFALVRLMPGNMMGAMVTRLARQGINPARARELVELRMTIDPDAPLLPAYVSYVSNTLQGDLGQSVYYSRPVVDIIAEAVPWTLFVLSWAVFISFFIGISIGALMAYWEGGKLDVGLTSYAVLMGSIPFYVLAILLLIFLAYRLSWFPTGGRQPIATDPGFNLVYISGIVRHAALPVISMLVASGVASLGMRGNSIRVLGEDYLRVARLRGLSDITISTQYVARNAVLPMYTTLLISIGEMFGGSIVLEQVFQYRGVGWYMLSATHQRDYPLMMGGFMVITVAMVISLLLADLTYGYVDPRARRSQ
ncbi:binding-protein-dependent transport systems inner membrane component (plasmid) [Haloterrigena turkmenica DSM 5511]|uniref:Binding-protein-dependent transport systems inner membrane component n=1 Tax=Haloterrigena turkmenica (strain ATCC 51198 / DSM 5511 / JCM 9101 / NCIMB 13204 / VKM B-1734 / 4k) TaxID=543526 RepID=D2S1L5_HALTV|nr:ABC transporter permease [Haloterrigena turkmenica]ADB63262.1 binding-protein-dependent transport systems inner membrane component [Haloterrigena turkmenica DSM 5511]